MKAIHNRRGNHTMIVLVVINHKLQNLKAIHNGHWRLCFACCCYQSQNYKIWKQFTTHILLIVFSTQLLSITKLQNLKAIHNCHRWRNYPIWVVINHKTTKFESNSQHKLAGKRWTIGCYQSQNYKIWKQFTT